MSNDTTGIAGYETQETQVKTSDNTKMHVIKISKEKLKVNTMEFLKFQNQYFIKFTILLTVMIPLTQNQFEDFMGVPGDQIKNLLSALSILVILDLIRAILKLFHNKYLSIDDFIKLCENNESYQYRNFITRLFDPIKEFFTLKRK